MRSKKNTRRGKSVAGKAVSSLGKGKAKGDRPIAPTPSRLLSVPPEIRLLIYDTYFSSPSYGKGFPKTNPFDGYTVDDVDASLIGALTDRFERSKDGNTQRARSNINLLSVCRLIHSEAIPPFYHHHLFQLPTRSISHPDPTATPIKPLIIPLAIYRHFDLIHRLEVVHHDLGHTIVNRQDNDLAIANVLEFISKACPSLRCLSIRVICDLHDEMDYFAEMTSWGEYPYLEFERKTPGVLAELMPRLHELAIVLTDSKPHPVPEHPELPLKAFSGSWTWAWHADDFEDAAGEEDEKRKENKEREENGGNEEDEEGEENEESDKGKDTSMQRWGEHFFIRRPGSSSEVPSMDEVSRDSLYQIASLEPFAHWFDPETM
ncbi:MAG: hypothetical protein OHK93_005295 [Ramalina farinacea]|uniref:DUF7730 domain-containing protein n=1 Tax=Ramalina farinacea TaxID=258253 RepID=A0AA43R082_9LECA|nr:hypothetical protein [Ramalina farinacea]